MKKNKKILVTGGAGYIGSHTIVELLNSGYDVVSIDNFCHSNKDVFKRIKKITGIVVKNYDADVCDQKKIEAIFKKEKNISGIIHFAAFKSVGESVKEPQRYFRNNLDSLMSIIACAGKYTIPSIVFSSSSSVYGSATKLPVDEETKLGKAESPYAATKQIGEEILSNIAPSMKNTKIIALRYFNPVGAHESAYIGENPTEAPNNLVPVITEVGIGKRKSLSVFGNDYETRDGTCVRDYVHVCDVAKAHVLALKRLDNKSSPNYDVFNLGNGNGVTVLEMINAFEKISGKKLSYKISPRRKGDVVAVYSNPNKALKLLGWKPERSLDTMMESAWKWQKNLKNKI